MRFNFFLDPINNLGLNFVTIFFMIFHWLLLWRVFLHFFLFLSSFWDSVVKTLSSFDLIFFILSFLFLHSLNKLLILFLRDVFILWSIFLGLFNLFLLNRFALFWNLARRLRLVHESLNLSYINMKKSWWIYLIQNKFKFFWRKDSSWMF